MGGHMPYFLLAVVTTVRSAAADPRILTPLEVVDGGGARVGLTISTIVGFPVTVGMLFDGRVWAVSVLPDQIDHGGPVYFESTDCSGQPYVFPNPNAPTSLVLSAVVAGADWSVYTYDPTEALFRHRVNSRITYTACTAISQDLDTVHATLQVRLGNYLQQPFSVRPSAP